MALASGPVQWGDVATWVGSVGTAFAFFAALVVLFITRQEQNAAREDDRRAQARQVSAWSVDVSPAAADGRQSVTVTVHNGSDESLYGLRVAVGAAWSGEKVDSDEVTDLSFVTPPKYHKEDHTVHLKLTALPGGGYEQSLPVELVFADAGGRFWRRDRYGGLTQLRLTDREPSSAAKHLFTAPANPL